MTQTLGGKVNSLSRVQVTRLRITGTAAGNVNPQDLMETEQMCYIYPYHLLQNTVPVISFYTGMLRGNLIVKKEENLPVNTSTVYSTSIELGCVELLLVLN